MITCKHEQDHMVFGGIFIHDKNQDYQGSWSHRFLFSFFFFFCVCFRTIEH